VEVFDLGIQQHMQLVVWWVAWADLPIGRAVASGAFFELRATAFHPGLAAVVHMHSMPLLPRLLNALLCCRLMLLPPPTPHLPALSAAAHRPRRQHGQPEQCNGDPCAGAGPPAQLRLAHGGLQGKPCVVSLPAVGVPFGATQPCDLAACTRGAFLVATTKLPGCAGLMPASLLR